MPHKPTGHSRDDILTRDELAALVDAATDPLDKVILSALAYYGMRADELAAMRRDWLDFHKGLIQIPETDRITKWRPKSSAGARTIPALDMSPNGWDAIRRYMTAHEGIDISRQTIYRRTVKLSHAAGMTRRIYPHALRATAATEAAYKINNPSVLCDIFGWSDLKTAQIYIRRAGGQAQEAVKRAYGRADSR